MKSAFAAAVAVLLVLPCLTASGQSPDDLAPGPGRGFDRKLPADPPANPPDADRRLREGRRRAEGLTPRGRTPGLETPTCPLAAEGAPNLGERPPVGRVIRVARHATKVRIVDGVAVTEIDQTFRNEEPMQVEGVYTFPIPAGAVVTGFSIFEGGAEVQGAIMERMEGRRTYDRITRWRRDPGLLELVGRHRPKVRMRVFPIPARGEMRVKLSYAHVLAPKGGGYETSVALKALTGRYAEKAELSVDALFGWPVALRLTKGFPFERRTVTGTRSCALGFEALDFRPKRDLEVRCRTDRPEPGLLLHVQKAANGERFFMAVIGAGSETLRDPELAIEGVETTGVYPPKLGTLLPGRVVHVFGKIEGNGTPVGVLRARRGTAEVGLRAEPTIGAGFVAGMWAHERTRRIQARAGIDAMARQAIVELGKRHRILTRYNAVLAR